MRETIVIPLSKPLRAHGGESITQIILRAPTYNEYFEIGDPWMAAISRDGDTVVPVEDFHIIKKYLDICVVEPKDTLLLSQADARVARKVKEKLLTFFPDPPEEQVSEISLTTSPSAASDNVASTT
jgi:hypothetical protein